MKTLCYGKAFQDVCDAIIIREAMYSVDINCKSFLCSEIAAIQLEFDGKKNRDIYRLAEIIVNFAEKEHPLRKFSHGNQATLEKSGVVNALESHFKSKPDMS